MTNDKIHYEIERKWLIAYPDLKKLESMKGATVSAIDQTYLKSNGEFETRRVRRRKTGPGEKFYQTTKRRVSGVRAEEDEQEISKEEYDQLMKEKDPSLQLIRKTRIAFPYDGNTVEIDLYPFWKKQAVMEIELPDEDAPARYPDFIHVIREVSDDFSYKNVSLAREIPAE